MFALEGEFRLRVVEALVHGLERYLLPPRRVVAGLAALREGAMVRVFVTVGTLAEWNSGVSGFAVRSRCVALGALHLCVQSGQRIARLAMIELPNVDGFPVFKVVTRLTGLSETSVVWILVASCTGGGQTEVSPSEIFDSDRDAFRGGNSRRCMTAIAAQSRMLAFESVSRLFVIECLDVPLDEREIFAIVFRVAARALLARIRRNVVSGVQSPVSSDAACDLRMTIQALQSRLSAEFVTTGAIRRSVQRLMGAGERAGRNLCRSAT